jgi:hypothetical protein
MNNQNVIEQPEPPTAVRSSDGLGGITFDLYEYNPRRKMRGVEAARVKVTEDGEEYLLWMSPKNIRDNLKLHGESKGLRDALEAYRINAMPPNS